MDCGWKLGTEDTSQIYVNDGDFRTLQRCKRPRLDLEASPHAAHAIVVPLVDQAVSLRLAGRRALRVCFDGCTHTSGNQRAFIHCGRHAKHCRLYRFPHMFSSTNHCIAYLIAWCWHGDDKYAEDVSASIHVSSLPPQSLVDTVFAALWSITTRQMTFCSLSSRNRKMHETC